jgi:hypothetical protein
MTNLKTIAATLAVLGSGALTLSACNKDKPATETPGGADAIGGESSCSAEKGEGSCSGDKEGEGSCSAEGSCSGDKEGEAEPEGGDDGE